MKTIIEPFRIKMTEQIHLTTASERSKYLKESHNNVFLIDAEYCCIDLLTDSGTGAMSAQQWAALMLGDESYAGSKSWKKFESTLSEITGMPHIFPTHQGRAAESLLVKTQVKSTSVIPNNSHFDTTRANIESSGATALDLLYEHAYQPDYVCDFKGDMDTKKLEKVIEAEGAENIPFCMITVTNNSGGGQPVSMQNMKGIKKILTKHNIPMIIDACRFAENAYFIKTREPEYADKSLLEISREMFDLADGATMSCKKDGLSNIGGFFVCRDPGWAVNFKNALIMQEGFPTYGGLAGRDLEVISVGLKEALEFDYQNYRHATVKYLEERLTEKGIPVVKPAGGHAIFLDAKAFCEHLGPEDFPGIGLVNELYLQGGVRGVARLELVRLAFPRRVYTQSHFDYLIEVIDQVWKNRKEIPKHKITYQPEFLRHFTAHFERG